MSNSTVADQQVHAASYYAARQPPRALRKPLKGREDTDVAIIGGGLAGLTAALELSRRGHSVALVESRRIGWGASGRNGGFVSPGFAESIGSIERKTGVETAKKLYNLSVTGVEYVEDTIAAAGRSDIIAGRGWLHVIRHGKVGAFRAWRDRMARDYGAEMEFLDRSGLQQVLKTDCYQAGVVDRKPFHIDPLAYAELLLALCLNAGVRVFEGTEVSEVAKSGASFVLKAPSGQVRSARVVVATSAYGGPISQIERSILPVATYVVTSRPFRDSLAEIIGYRGCIADQRRAGDYYRLVEDELGLRLLWGGRITTRRSEPARLGEMLLRDIQRIYPQLGDLEIEFNWSGLMGYARHKMPIVGELQPGLFALTGFGGHGLNATASGAIAVTDAIAGDDGRLKLFKKFGPVWGGGPFGRLATQLEYMRLRLTDALDEM
ncbi:NAD(P)/FAD-dependent oxidoreductase [Hoeflea sp. TYP-13]|uniref:NAD(P)/FAD-dependent oxidoreductase n=1 Tax=Hoeflea sp. TYP-13 TaxID=3230023 RepID=UPI0034C5DF7D